VAPQPGNAGGCSYEANGPATPVLGKVSFLDDARTSTGTGESVLGLKKQRRICAADHLLGSAVGQLSRTLDSHPCALFNAPMRPRRTPGRTLGSSRGPCRAVSAATRLRANPFVGSVSQSASSKGMESARPRGCASSRRWRGGTHARVGRLDRRVSAESRNSFVLRVLSAG